jgi:hypothetical protein
MILNFPLLFSLVSIFFFIVVLGGSTLWNSQKFLQYIKYLILVVTSSTNLFYPSYSLFWNSFNRYHFSIYIHMYTVYMLYSPSHTLFPPPLSLNGYQSPRQDLFCPPVLWFALKKKKWHFCFFKLATQGISLWYFHAYMYIYIHIYIF